MRAVEPMAALETPGKPFTPGPAGTHITIRGLTKYFAGWPLYEDFNLDIPKHRIVSVFGPNGCGKSTLINMIAGLVPIDAARFCSMENRWLTPRSGMCFRTIAKRCFRSCAPSTILPTR